MMVAESFRAKSRITLEDKPIWVCKRLEKGGGASPSSWTTNSNHSSRAAGGRRSSERVHILEQPAQLKDTFHPIRPKHFFAKRNGVGVHRAKCGSAKLWIREAEYTFVSSSFILFAKKIWLKKLFSFHFPVMHYYPLDLFKIHTFAFIYFIFRSYLKYLCYKYHKLLICQQISNFPLGINKVYYYSLVDLLHEN